MDYLQGLHNTYEREVQNFPGPVFVVDTNQSGDDVYAAVKLAVDTLHADPGRPRPPRSNSPSLVPGAPPMAPYTVRQFPSLELLFPGKLMTTCDPYLLRL